jgi:osmotically-inducible protein OsmY
MAGFIAAGGLYVVWNLKKIRSWHMRIASVLAVPSLLLLVAGCSTPYYDTSVSTRYPTYNGAVLTTSETDRALEASLRSQLNRYGDLRAVSPDVQMYSQNGTVTLSGTVPNERDRQMIETMARNTPGVLGVNDQLQVVYPPTGAYTPPPQGTYTSPSQVYSPPPPAAVITPTPAPVYPVGPNMTVQATSDTDRAIAQGISERLRPQTTLNTIPSGVNINVTDGKAYVRGAVSNEEQRAAIISAVRNTPGVTAVYDELTLR